MSILWFMFMMFCYGSGAKVTDLNLLMVPVLHWRLYSIDKQEIR